MLAELNIDSVGLRSYTSTEYFFSQRGIGQALQRGSNAVGLSRIPSLEVVVSALCLSSSFFLHLFLLASAFRQ